MLRKFELNDMDEVINIWLEASLKSHDFVDKSYWCSAAEDMRTIYIPDSDSYVYEYESVVCGFFSLFENSLAALFVLPAFQGKGFGTALMNKAKELRNELTLTVYKENPRSISFYENCGFKTVDEQIDEYTEHPEMVMVWSMTKL